MYSRDDDPWEFASSPYEARKFDLTVAALPRARYRSGFEPGCSNGELSARLATRCDELLACDLLEDVVRRAARRLAAQPHVRVERRDVSNEWPPGEFDLLVLSEMAYYFDERTLEEMMRLARSTCRYEADVIAVHWTGETDYPLSGRDAHRVIAQTPGLRPLVHHDDECFVLDVWRVDGTP